MDDIAKHLGVSKKTLYKEVDSKESLIKAVIEGYIQDEKTFVDGIFANSENAVDEIFQMSAYLIEFLKQVKPSTQYELRKYYPKLASLIDEGHMKYIRSVMEHNLRRGIREKLYRSDLNSTLIITFYMNNTRWLSEQTEHAPVDVYRAYINYHLLGIMNEQGLAIYRAYLKKLEYA